MRAISVEEFARRCGGSLSGVEPGAMIQGFALDNRQVRAGDLFVAIRGARVDGHEFAASAVSGGAVAALVERPVEAPSVVVDSVVGALARYAASVREGFHGPVIGITGSAGKTSTKEFVAAAVSPLGRVLKTEGNRNTEYTAPLVWAELGSEHQVAVIEMSMRGFGQVAHLAAFSRPTVGIVTNIGHAHMEMVGSREGIARAKGELLDALREDGTAILWAEDEFLEVLRGLSRARVRTFGFGVADCRIAGYRPVSWSEAEVEGTLDGERWWARLPAVGRHMALNAAAAVLAASAVGVRPEEAALRLPEAVLPPMRMEVRRLGGLTLVLDTYNASPPSMIAAIETLAEMPVEGRRLAVIGEMKELGEESIEGHRQVGEALAARGLDEVVFVGEGTRPAERAAREGGLSRVRSAGSLAEVTEFLRSMRDGDVVLIKGSRALELERALEPLQETVA